MQILLEIQGNMLIFYDRDFRTTIKLWSMLECNPKLIGILKLLVRRVFVPKLPGIISSRLGISDKIYVNYLFMKNSMENWEADIQATQKPKTGCKRTKTLYLATPIWSVFPGTQP